MGKLVLTYIGEDSWSRPTYKDESGQLFKDVNCGRGVPELCTVNGGFEGEPDTQIEHIKRFKGLEIELVGRENIPTKDERYNYQLLDRLRSDCEYYLGNGNRCEKHLWAGDVPSQIEKMKELYNGFEDNKKPEWLTWEQIIEYEKKMI